MSWKQIYLNFITFLIKVNSDSWNAWLKHYFDIRVPHWHNISWSSLKIPCMLFMKLLACKGVNYLVQGVCFYALLLLSERHQNTRLAMSNQLTFINNAPPQTMLHLLFYGNRDLSLHEDHTVHTLMQMSFASLYLYFLQKSL